MTVGPDAGIRIGNGAAIDLTRPDCLGKVFNIDLVADTGTRRHNAEIFKRLAAPGQEGIAFTVARHFQFNVSGKTVSTRKMVNHHRMVDDQING